MGATATVPGATDSSGRDHGGPLVSRAKGFDIISCITCGFRHVVPLPDEAGLRARYRDAYYSEDKPDFLARASEDAEWSDLASRDRLERFDRLLPSRGRRILDVGCGPGFFLKTAMNEGWQAVGLEPSRQAAEHARGLGLHVVEGFFDRTTAAGLGLFDVVHLNNVLEHVPDPAAIVALAHGLIAPGGLICLAVPNDFSLLQVAARASLSLSEWWVAPPHHLNYFDFESLGRLLERLGFEVQERTTSFPMELFLLMGLDYTNDPALGRACHLKRKRFDLALDRSGFGEFRRRFYRALADLGIGREALVIAKRP